MNLLFSNDQRGKYPPSYYADTAPPLASFPPLRGETRADVCVVGAGYTGLSAALHLAEQGLDVVVVDAHRVGFGASGRNGGQLGSGYNMAQDVLEKRLGHDIAHRLWALAEDAKTLTKSLIKTHAPDAGFKPGIAHAQWQSSAVQDTHKYSDYLAKNYGYEQLENLNRQDMRGIIGSPCYQGGAIDRGAGHIHPLRYAFGLARAASKAGARMFEMTNVHHIKRGARAIVQTDRGRINADHVILACNGYLGGLDRSVAARVMPINNYIVATEPLGDRAASVLSQDIGVDDSKFVVNYFRLSEDKRLIFGGGETYGYRYPKDIADKVRKPMARVFPQLAGVKIDYAWGGTLAVTMNRMPHFSRPAPNMYSVSGYSGFGVAMAGLAGKTVADAIAGQGDNFDLFASIPSTRFPGGPPFSRALLVLAMSWYSLRDQLGR